MCLLKQRSNLWFYQAIVCERISVWKNCWRTQGKNSSNQVGRSNRLIDWSWTFGHSWSSFNPLIIGMHLRYLGQWSNKFRGQVWSGRNDNFCIIRIRHIFWTHFADWTNKRHGYFTNPFTSSNFMLFLCNIRRWFLIIV